MCKMPEMALTETSVVQQRTDDITSAMSKLGVEHKKAISKIELLEKEVELVKLQQQAKDEEMERMRRELERLRQESTINLSNTHNDDEREKVVHEYYASENYLLELVEEFKFGMREIYKDRIEFKEVDQDDMRFCERFSNLLYNVLLIIDFQKSEIDRLDPQQNPGPPQFENKTMKFL